VTAQRTLFIGDVHGCAAELDDLLNKCDFTTADRVVFVGDLVAKGPDSVEVVQRAMQIGALCVRGNHEDAVLRARIPNGKRVKATHAAVADALDEMQWRWLSGLPVSLHLPELNILVVHAGLVPQVPIEAQRAVDLMCMRTLRDDGTASTRLHDGVLWATRWEGPEHVVFGHDAMTGLQQHPFATGLDTGCVYGGKLTALILPEGRMCDVQARHTYVPVP